jgi:hypothetical protein
LSLFSGKLGFEREVLEFDGCDCVWASLRFLNLQELDNGILKRSKFKCWLVLNWSSKSSSKRFDLSFWPLF